MTTLSCVQLMQHIVVCHTDTAALSKCHGVLWTDLLLSHSLASLRWHMRAIYLLTGSWARKPQKLCVVLFKSEM